MKDILLKHCDRVEANDNSIHRCYDANFRVGLNYYPIIQLLFLIILERTHSDIADTC